MSYSHFVTVTKPTIFTRLTDPKMHGSCVYSCIKVVIIFSLRPKVKDSRNYLSYCCSWIFCLIYALSTPTTVAPPKCLFFPLFLSFLYFYFQQEELYLKMKLELLNKNGIAFKMLETERRMEPDTDWGWKSVLTKFVLPCYADFH